MVDQFLWVVVLGPFALALAAFLGGTAEARNRIALGAAFLTLGLALLAAIAVGFGGTIHTQTLGAAGIGVNVYLDSLSATMFCLVSFIGLIVLAYSRNYMDGDPGQLRFTRLLCLTLSAVLSVIIAGNLLTLILAWIGTSTGLQRLLLFYPERPGAILAAHKKFLTSRMGDVCLIGAAILLYRTFGSLDYEALFAGSAAMLATGAAPPSVHVAAMLVVIAALLKSAQFPLHGWLIEVMETPTPVSALLHAGIINAGGFLILRLSNVVSLSFPSLDVLAIVGGITALFGSVVMLTQTSIKVTLAYSTVAQMGYMMLECGLGAFPAALLHIVAHSLYKAHAFLSSGSVIDIARASWTPSPGGKPHPARLGIAIAGVLVVTLAVSRAFNASPLEKPGVFALGAVLLLGLIHLVSSGIDERPNVFVVGRVLAFASVVAVAYFGLQVFATWVVGSSVPQLHKVGGPFETTVVSVVVLAFAAVTFLQGQVPRVGSARFPAFYAHVANGLYVNTIANRFILRFLPTPEGR